MPPMMKVSLAPESDPTHLAHVLAPDRLTQTGDGPVEELVLRHPEIS